MRLSGFFCILMCTYIKNKSWKSKCICNMFWQGLGIITYLKLFVEKLVFYEPCLKKNDNAWIHSVLLLKTNKKGKRLLFSSYFWPLVKWASSSKLLEKPEIKIIIKFSLFKTLIHSIVACSLMRDNSPALTFTYDALRRAFYACVYCMQLRKTLVPTQLYFWCLPMSSKY